MQEWKRERVCRGGVAAWGPVVHKITHPLLLWKNVGLVGSVLSLKGAATGGSH
jgi:hypothetical protein